MAKDKKSIILYTDTIHTFEGLDDAEAGRLIKHLFRYVNDLNPEPPDKLTQIAFEPIKQQLKRDLQKWGKEREERTKSGHLGGLASAEARRSKHKQDEANQASASNLKQTQANQAVSVSVSVTDSVSDNNTSAEQSPAASEPTVVKPPKKEKAVDPLYSPMFDIYSNFIKNKVGNPPKVDGAEGNAMKSIIAYLRKLNPNDEEIKTGFNSIFLCFDKWDKFHQGQLKLTQINSNLINIINSIKNGKSSNSPQSPDDLLRETIELSRSREFINASSIDEGKHLKG